MKVFLTLLGREVKSYFYQPIAYVVMFYFLILTGFNFYSMTVLLNRGPAEITLVELFFSNPIFWFTFILIFPLITMRTYSEEYRMGTLETLTTAPVRDWQVIVSKFLGVVIFFCVLIAPNILYFAAFQLITGQQAAMAAGAYWGSYFILLLMAMFYISIGCLASSMVKDQINAAIISFSAITIYFFLGLLLSFLLNTTDPNLRDLNTFLSSYEHMGDFSKGLIDSRPIIWYLSMTVFMLFITHQVFQSRKWKA